MPSKKNRRKQKRESDAHNPSISCGEEAERATGAGCSSTSLTQNISGTNVQIGHGNTIFDRRSVRNVEKDGSCVPLPAATDQRKTYADVVSGKDIKQDIRANTVNITINTNPSTPEDDKETTSTTINRQQIASFLESVDNFDKGDFILVVGKQTSVDYLESLALVKWIAVLDFDPDGRSTGLLSYIESTLNKRRSLHIGSIQDTFTFSEQITNWIFMMGCADRPDTRTTTDVGEWKKEMNELVDEKLLLLKQFEAGVTYLKCVVLWPSDANTAKCMHFILSKACIHIKSVVIIDVGAEKSSGSILFLDVLREEKEVTVIELGVREMCQAITKVSKQFETESSGFCLPTKDGTNDPGISDEQAQWLKEDLEVLYLNNKTGVEYNSQQMIEEEDIFHKGGTLPWSWWYEVGPGHADIVRDITKSLVNSTVNNYLKNRKSGIITLLHFPGSGGTTLSQQVLWQLKDRFPCAQMKQNSSSPVNALVEKIACISDRTNKPVVILLDGEDEHRVRSLQRLSEQIEICILMLYVRRITRNADDYEGRRDIFFLRDELSKHEARLLKLKYSTKTEHENRRKNIDQLVVDVENDQKRTIFEFGLAAHSYEYTGIQAYVRSHLRLDDTGCNQLLPWQTSLAYLSLVYFYGHTSIPCHFFTKILVSAEKENKMMLKMSDFPQEMQEFIVPGVNESRTHTVRISHYYVAKEILDQVLTRPNPPERTVSPYLCSVAKKVLGSFCPGFIENAGKINDGNSSDVISKMMINTFIQREPRAIREDETQDKRHKRQNKSKFSHILEDASSSAPFTERFDILEQLVVSFPSEAQFRAHLGRLYEICRPEEDKKAEENLQKAYEMSSSILDGTKSIDEIPYSRRLDIRNICHMYGTMLSKRVFKYTGKFSDDKPAIAVGKDQFPAVAEKLLPDVQRACKLFSTNRDVMSPGFDECLGFGGEIQVRLMLCRLIKEKCGAPDLDTFVCTNKGAVAEFVSECFVNLDNLFDEMCDVADEKSMVANVRPLQEMYLRIMRPHTPGHVAYKVDKDTSQWRRLKISRMKAQYNAETLYGLLEKLKQRQKVEIIVDSYEQNFRMNDPSDNYLDNDYRIWVRAIRHPSFPERYSIEKVYMHVQNWFDLIQAQKNARRKIHAMFYNFVLSSILGFGTFGQTGNLELLRKSLALKKELIEISKYSQNTYHKLEWLGPPVQTIDRITPGKRFYGEHQELSLDKDDLSHLEIRIGTVCPPNNKPKSGFITLDLGPENRESVKIHFVPSRWNLKGTGFKSHRVEFVIGFDMAHGYEAFMVKPVGHVKCANKKCGNIVEKRSSDKTVKCLKCFKLTDIQND